MCIARPEDLTPARAALTGVFNKISMNDVAGFLRPDYTSGLTKLGELVQSNVTPPISNFL